tara:strand:- start:1000 stop:1656 length:657 start_codon:yes stop_codon:yes gene_type:complete
MDTLIPGISAGIVSSIVCNPLDVLRINKQINTKIILNANTCFKGLSYGVYAITPYWAIYFSIYEKLKTNNNLNIPLSAYISTCIASTVTTPFWVMKQKAQTDKMHDIYKMTYGQFYSGLIPTYILALTFTVQIPLYEYLKSKTNNSTFNTFINTSVSKTVASSIFYPLDTVRVVLRNGGNFSGMKIHHYYRGLGIYLMRSIPYHTSVFCTFEFVKNFM